MKHSIELLDTIWPDAIVSETALSSVLEHVRRVLGDDRSKQHFIRTLRGQGYRFVAAVELDSITVPDPARPALIDTGWRPRSRWAAPPLSRALGLSILVSVRVAARSVRHSSSMSASPSAIPQMGAGSHFATT